MYVERPHFSFPFRRNIPSSPGFHAKFWDITAAANSGAPVVLEQGPVAHEETVGPINWTDRNIPGLGTDNWSTRIEGLVLPEFTEEYTFYVTSDDAVRLFVNDESVDGWVSQGPTPYSLSVDLNAGKVAEVTIEHAQGGVGERLLFEWQSASRGRQTVPLDRMFLKGDSRVTVDEQDTTEHVRSCENVIVRCPLGFRDDRPEFGWPFPEFANTPIDVAELEDALRTLEPRGRAHATEYADAAELAVRRISVDVEVDT